MHEKEQPEGKPLLVTMATRQPGEAKGKGKDGGRFCRFSGRLEKEEHHKWRQRKGVKILGNGEVEINQSLLVVAITAISRVKYRQIQQLNDK